MPGYDLVQSIFLMSQAAGGASDIEGSDTALRARLADCLNGTTNYQGFFPWLNQQLEDGDWKVVWGPDVYCDPVDLGFATNAMYVAYSAKRQIYVVAIAGTNPDSWEDWVKLDVNVSPNVAQTWPPQVPYKSQFQIFRQDPTVQQVSAATALGLSNLLTELQDLTTGRLSLEAFLDKVADPSQTLIFTGHSLGGALAPALAYFLYPTPAQSGWKDVFYLASAGPSPGSIGLANAISAAYPATQIVAGKPYGSLNMNHWSMSDLVPHAWDKIDTILWANPQGSSIFGTLDTLIWDGVNAITTAAKAVSSGSSFYLGLSPTGFTPPKWIQYDRSQTPPVEVALTEFTDANPMVNPIDLKTYLTACHIDQYFPYFETAPFPVMS